MKFLFRSDLSCDTLVPLPQTQRVVAVGLVGWLGFVQALDSSLRPGFEVPSGGPQQFLEVSLDPSGSPLLALGSHFSLLSLVAPPGNPNSVGNQCF